MQTTILREDSGAVTAAPTPLQVRGRSFTAVVLKPAGGADKPFFDALDALMRQAPHFFVNAPLVIDLEAASGLEAKADFMKLVRDLRARRLTPIGVQNGTPDQGVAAFGAGLVTLQGGRDASLEREAKAKRAEEETTSSAPEAVQEAAPEAAPASAAARSGDAGSATLIVTEPVRSGQRLFADRGDLIVTASVSSGAELVATGSIHVYGPMRGRALAGVNGDRTARIFCQQLEAELIAIAGLYLTDDDLGPGVRGQRVQAFLRDETLCVEPLK